MPDHSKQVPAEVRKAALRLQQPQAMRRGSLSERHVKCSKPGCACGQDPNARHGPYYSVTRGIGGRTQSRLVSAEKAEIVRQQIAAGQEFRKWVEDYWTVCERWADEQLEEGHRGLAKQSAKKDFRNPPKKRSPGKPTA